MGCLARLVFGCRCRDVAGAAVARGILRPLPFSARGWFFGCFAPVAWRARAAWRRPYFLRGWSRVGWRLAQWGCGAHRARVSGLLRLVAASALMGGLWCLGRSSCKSGERQQAAGKERTKKASGGFRRERRGWLRIMRGNRKTGQSSRRLQTRHKTMRAANPRWYAICLPLAFIACPKRAAGDDVKNAAGDTPDGEAVVADGVFHALGRMAGFTS